MKKIYLFFALLWLCVACTNKHTEAVDQYLKLSEELIGLYEQPYQPTNDSLIEAKTLELSKINTDLAGVYDELSESQVSDIMEMGTRVVSAVVVYQQHKYDK